MPIAFPARSAVGAISCLGAAPCLQLRPCALPAADVSFLEPFSSSFVVEEPAAPLPSPQLSAALAGAASTRQQLAANPIWQAELAQQAQQVQQDGGAAEEPPHLKELRRKSELLQEAEQLRRRMRASQLTRWVRWEVVVCAAGRGGVGDCIALWERGGHARSLEARPRQLPFGSFAPSPSAQTEGNTLGIQRRAARDQLCLPPPPHRPHPPTQTHTPVAAHPRVRPAALGRRASSAPLCCASSGTLGPTAPLSSRGGLPARLTPLVRPLLPSPGHYVLVRPSASTPLHGAAPA